MTEIEQELAKLTAAQQKRVLSRLRKAYQQASATVWQKTRELMDAYAESGLQSKIYQARFQKALDSILDGTLDKLREDSYKTVSAYVEDCYEQGFLGALYDMQGQGVPLVFPVDPAQMYKAVTLDSRLSKPMYEKMGIDTAKLKRAVREELSRGIASGLTYDEIASGLNRRMGTGQYNAWRIARTEGGRVQSEAAYHAQQKAKENGADVVKQWNACLDSRVRPDHALLHNQIRETDEPFEVNGHTAMHPHGFGVAKEDINCRCSLLTRARWALSEEELAQLETDDDVTVEEIEAGSYQEFREKLGGVISQNSHDGKALALQDVDSSNLGGLLDGHGISRTLKAGKQLEHLLGASYIEGNSYFYGTLDDVISLIERYAGTGDFSGMTLSGAWDRREIVDCAEIIGDWIDKNGKPMGGTRYMTIVYSKKGIHAFPSRGKE